MRRLLFILFLCVHWTAWAQTGYEYRYWFDGDEQALQTGTSASSAWNFSVNVNQLKEAFHVLYFQVSDSQRGLSATHSRMFYKMPIDTIMGVTYWFNDDTIATKEIRAIRAIDIDVSHLPDGVHYLHAVVLRDNLSQTSVPKSAIFWKSLTANPYELTYWFDDDVTNKYSLGNIQGLVEIDVSKLKEGLHFLHMMAVNPEDNETSVTRTVLFWKLSSLASRKYKLWIDDDYANAKVYSQTGQPVELDVASLDEGLHYLNVQVEGEANSSVLRELFIKTPTLAAHQTMECIISVDGKEYKRETVNGSNAIVNCSFDVSDLSVGFHRAHVMMKMPSGIVSSIKDAYFYRVPTDTQIADMKLLYAVDDENYRLAANQVGNGLYQLDIDVANLEKGEHNISCMLVGADGMQTRPVTGKFLTGYYDLKYFVDGEMLDSLCIGQGDSIAPREEPLKDGYVFGGWENQPETMPEHDVTVNGSFVRLGDVNVNGSVTAGDVVISGNYILKRNPETFFFKAADINKDEKISMSDIVTIIDIVLEGTVFAVSAHTRSYTLGLDMGKAVFKNGVARVPVNLDNTMPYSAFQMDVVLPEGISLESVSLTARSQGTHRVTWRKLANGRVRVLVYAADNAVFRGNAGELVSINLSGFSVGDPELDVSLENVIFATPEGHENFMGNTTSIVSPANDELKIYVRNGTLFVESDRELTSHLYNLQGQLVRTLHLHEGTNTYSHLPAGVYVLNGVKVVIDN